MFNICILLILARYITLSCAENLSNKHSIRTHPCNDTEVIVEVFENDDSFDDVNKFYLFIDLSKYKSGKKISANSTIYLKFDSEGRVTLNPKIGRISPSEGSNFLILLNKEKSGWIRMVVSASMYDPVPNILNVTINGDELCPAGVKKGIWDTYMEKIIIQPRFNSPENDLTDTCGKRMINSSSVNNNGLESIRGEWPWHAALYIVNKATRSYICGGTLIKSSCVVTAGHCVIENDLKINNERLYVVFGKYNLQGGDEGTQEIKAYRIIIHPEYEFRMSSNDIALVMLDAEVKYDKYIQPICLWKNINTDHTEIYGKSGTVAGWKFKHVHDLPKKMMSVNIPVVSHKQCSESNPNFYLKHLKDRNYCAGFKNGTSVCNGGSGGGMYFSEVNYGLTIWYLRGIVSLAVSKADSSECDPNHYTLFTDITRYLYWIETYL